MIHQTKGIIPGNLFYHKLWNIMNREIKVIIQMIIIGAIIRG